MRHAKFIALQSGRNVGVGFGVNIRVDANAHWRCGTHGQRHARQHGKLSFALYIKAANARFERLSHFSASFADPRKNNFTRVTASGNHTV